MALSVAWAATANIFSDRLTARRLVAVFVCGLFHGFGFGSALASARPPDEGLLGALVKFNLGVELGQLAVLAIALAAVFWIRDPAAYRKTLGVPCSVFIALVGLYWTFERIFVSG